MAVTQDQRQVARNRIETLVRATFAIQGFGEPDPKFVFSIVDKAETHLTQRQMHHPDGISLASIGDLAPVIAAVKPPPANIYGAGGPSSGNGGMGSEKSGPKNIDPSNLALRGNTPSRSGGENSDGARYTGAASSRIGGDYQLLDLNSPQSLHQLTGIGWGTTAASLPYARAGLNFGTVKDLRNYDKAFTGQDVLKAASDVKKMGFDVNDKRSMRNHATIRHYDNDADATNDAERKFKHGVDNDKDMQELLRQRGLCKDPVQAKALDTQIEQHKQQHIHESGLDQRINDPKNHPKAKTAIKDDVDQIVHHNQHYRREHGNDAARKVGTDELVRNQNQANAAPTVDNQKSKIAAADAGKDGNKAKNDLVADLGVDDGPTKPSAPQAPAKPAPVKVAAKGPSPSRG